MFEKISHDINRRVPQECVVLLYSQVVMEAMGQTVFRLIQKEGCETMDKWTAIDVGVVCFLAIFHVKWQVRPISAAVIKEVSLTNKKSHREEVEYTFQKLEKENFNSGFVSTPREISKKLKLSSDFFLENSHPSEKLVRLMKSHNIKIEGYNQKNIENDAKQISDSLFFALMAPANHDTLDTIEARTSSIARFLCYTCALLNKHSEDPNHTIDFENEFTSTTKKYDFLSRLQSQAFECLIRYAQNDPFDITDEPTTSFHFYDSHKNYEPKLFRITKKLSREFLKIDLERYMCPITLQVMAEPVFCKLDGKYYEKEAIIEQLKLRGETPTRVKLQKGKTIEEILEIDEGMKNRINMLIKEGEFQEEDLPKSLSGKKLTLI